MSAQARSSEPTIVPDHEDCAPVGMMLDGTLACIKGQNVIFSPSRKAIFSLNDTAAEIWRCLEEGMRPGEIAAEIACHGVEPSSARAYVEAALDEWEQAGVLHPCLPPSFGRSGEVSKVVGVAGLTIGIVYPAQIAEWAHAAFRHLEAAQETADIQLQLVAGPRRIQLFRNGDWLLSCSAAELPTALKGQLLLEVLSNGSYELAIHAACLLSGDRSLLLCGSPGAGKTTLALALVNGGFGFAGDDVALLDAQGHCTGLPFAPAVKRGAWSVLTGYCPELSSAAVFRRPDGMRVRYPVPRASVRCLPRRVGWVVLLDRRSDGDARLDPVDPAGALRGLLDGSFASGGELSGTAFGVLARLIGTVEAWRLIYSRLPDAVALLREACR